MKGYQWTAGWNSKYSCNICLKAYTDKEDKKWKPIVSATGNQGKMKEIRMDSGGSSGVDPLHEGGWSFTPIVEENGKSSVENADIKAHGYPELFWDICSCRRFRVLEIDALNGEPGIDLLPVPGEDTSYRIKNANLIECLNGFPMKKEPPGSSGAISQPCWWENLEKPGGIIEGRIGYEERGANGSGYDPIFYLPEYGCSTAELDPETKNKRAHRGKARGSHQRRSSAPSLRRKKR